MRRGEGITFLREALTCYYWKVVSIVIEKDNNEKIYCYKKKKGEKLGENSGKIMF